MAEVLAVLCAWYATLRSVYITRRDVDVRSMTWHVVRDNRHKYRGIYDDYKPLLEGICSNKKCFYNG